MYTGINSSHPLAQVYLKPVRVLVGCLLLRWHRNLDSFILDNLSSNRIIELIRHTTQDRRCVFSYVDSLNVVAKERHGLKDW